MSLLKIFFYCRNCIRSELHYEDGSIDITNIFYDNKKGICSNINMPSWILRFHSFIPFYANHANNILRVEDSEGQEREQFEYEYNDQDYPIKVTETYLRPSKFRKANPYHTPYYTRLKKAVDDDVYEFSIQYIEAK